MVTGLVEPGVADDVEPGGLPRGIQLLLGAVVELLHTAENEVEVVGRVSVSRIRGNEIRELADGLAGAERALLPRHGRRAVEKLHPPEEVSEVDSVLRRRARQGVVIDV